MSPKVADDETVDATREANAAVEAMADDAENEYVPRTELGQLALAARREYLAAGGRLLDWDDLKREIAERRGGTHLLDDR